MSEIIRIPNIENYTQQIINGELVLTPKEIYITDDEFNRTIFNSSKILECSIENRGDLITNKLKYNSILIDIFKSMPTQKILQTTTFNMKLTNENDNKGYHWHPELKLSIQNKDANHTVKEILNMIKVNSYTIKICIQLETGKIIKYKYGL